jgi:hypothetical protein
MVNATQQPATSASGSQNLSLSRNVWRCEYQYAARLLMQRFRVATPACEWLTDTKDAMFRCREQRGLLACADSRSLPNGNVLVKVWN